MRLAVVTTPPSIGSGIGDYTWRLLPHLARCAEVTVFVAPGLEQEPTLEGLPLRSCDELRPREFDQVLYQLGNERHHAFMEPLVRSIGGTVALHDWVLFDLAAAAHPSLERGDWKGLLVTLREGGLSQAAVWWRNRMDRRAQRNGSIAPIEDPSSLPGVLLWGWHAPEPRGRWTADVAQMRPPPGEVRRLRVELVAPAPRHLRISQGNEIVLERDLPAGEQEVELGLDRDPAALLLLEVGGIEVTREQRRGGDGRRLGVFVRRLAFGDAGAWREVDLSGRAAAPLRPVDLARDRFRLPLNRGIVRFGDAFVVHSEHVARLVRMDRNAPTAIAVLPHGADPLWREDDRREERTRLGLPASWRDGFLVTHFGGLQARKRLDVVLEAVALARLSRPDVRLALVGAEHPDDVDVHGLVRRLGLDDAVRLTGHLPEDEARRWIHAGDLAVQLRGPTTGGTSGGLLQSLGQGRGVVASALDEQRELPDECVHKLHPGAGEAERLAQKLVDLRDSPAVRHAMEEAARAFVTASCRWELVAGRYAEALECFPSPRAARRSLIALRFQQGVRRGRERAAAGR